MVNNQHLHGKLHLFVEILPPRPMHIKRIPFLLSLSYLKSLCYSLFKFSPSYSDIIYFLPTYLNHALLSLQIYSVMFPRFDCLSLFTSPLISLPISLRPSLTLKNPLPSSLWIILHSFATRGGWGLRERLVVLNDILKDCQF